MYNINLIAGKNPGGPGFIGGKISKGARANEGMDGILVLLLDEYDQAIAYTYSKNGGDFEFNDLAYGTYKIYLDVLGIVSEPTTVTIDPTNEEIDNIHFIVNRNFIVSTSMNELSKNIQSIGTLYPNPATQQIGFNSLIMIFVGQCSAYWTK